MGGATTPHPWPLLLPKAPGGGPQETTGETRVHLTARKILRRPPPPAPPAAATTPHPPGE